MSLLAAPGQRQYPMAEQLPDEENTDPDGVAELAAPPSETSTKGSAESTIQRPPTLTNCLLIWRFSISTALAEPKPEAAQRSEQPEEQLIC